MSQTATYLISHEYQQQQLDFVKKQMEKTFFTIKCMENKYN